MDLPNAAEYTRNGYRLHARFGVLVLARDAYLGFRRELFERDRVAGERLMAPNEKPRLMATAWVTGEPLAYQCSQCGQVFLLPEDREPKDAVRELRAAFQDHLGEEHADEAKN